MKHTIKTSCCNKSCTHAFEPVTILHGRSAFVNCPVCNTVNKLQITDETNTADTAIDNKEYQKIIAARYLSKSTINQAQAIVNHYSACACIVGQLKIVLSARCVPDPTVDRVIEYCVEKIKEDHEKTFGIELKWEPET